MRNEKSYYHTRAVCPTCLEIVNASIVERDQHIYLKKNCKKHGMSYALICSDPEWYQESTLYVRPGQSALGFSVKEFKSCPDSCGLCPEHQQHTCLPVIEITSDCNLNCPICLKHFQKPINLTLNEFRNILRQLHTFEKNLNVINLSGGEPTLHPELEDFLKVSSEENIHQVTVSTNGIKFLTDEKLRKLFKKTGVIASLQFDGFLPQTYELLRGSDLSAQKKEIIEVLEDSGIKYSLVATIAKDINNHEITDIVDFFFKSKAISLMFQPAAFTGTASSQDFDPDSHRITIPDVVKEAEKSEHIKKGDFNPVPCSHYSCFAVSYYLIVNRGNYLNLKDFLGRENYINILTNRAYPGLDKEGFSVIKERIYDLWSASDSSDASEHILQRIREIFKKLNLDSFSAREVFNLGIESMKSIFIHQFMDVHTLDFKRLVKCCNHYPLADGRIIPMCAQNVFFQ